MYCYQLCIRHYIFKLRVVLPEVHDLALVYIKL